MLQFAYLGEGDNADPCESKYTVHKTLLFMSGELLAAFELFEVGAGEEGVALLPALPNPKEGQHMEGVGPILPVPPEIRPTLVKYRWALCSTPIFAITAV